MVRVEITATCYLGGDDQMKEMHARIIKVPDNVVNNTGNTRCHSRNDHGHDILSPKIYEENPFYHR